MSCRHDLALGTCKECYPSTGTVMPTWPGESMDGPGAAPRVPDIDAVQIHMGWLTKCRSCRHWEGKRVALLSLPQDEVGKCVKQQGLLFGQATSWEGLCPGWDSYDIEAMEFVLLCLELHKDPVRCVEDAMRTESRP